MFTKTQSKAFEQSKLMQETQYMTYEFSYLKDKKRPIQINTISISGLLQCFKKTYRRTRNYLFHCVGMNLLLFPWNIHFIDYEIPDFT